MGTRCTKRKKHVSFSFRGICTWWWQDCSSQSVVLCVRLPLSLPSTNKRGVIKILHKQQRKKKNKAVMVFFSLKFGLISSWFPFFFFLFFFPGYAWASSDNHSRHRYGQTWFFGCYSNGRRWLVGRPVKNGNWVVCLIDRAQLSTVLTLGPWLSVNLKTFSAFRWILFFAFSTFDLHFPTCQHFQRFVFFFSG